LSVCRHGRRPGRLCVGEKRSLHTIRRFLQSIPGLLVPAFSVHTGSVFQNKNQKSEPYMLSKP